MCQGRFRLDNMNNFIERVVMHWNTLPMEMAELPSVEGFRGHVDVALRFGRELGSIR